MPDEMKAALGLPTGGPAPTAATAAGSAPAAAAKPAAEAQVVKLADANGGATQAWLQASALGGPCSLRGGAARSALGAC